MLGALIGLCDPTHASLGLDLNWYHIWPKPLGPGLGLITWWRHDLSLHWPAFTWGAAGNEVQAYPLIPSPWEPLCPVIICNLHTLKVVALSHSSLSLSPPTTLIPRPSPGAGLIGQSRGRAGHPVHLTPDPSDTLGLSLKCRRPEQVCSYKAAQWEATSPLALAFGHGCQLNAVNRRQQKQDINLERGQEEVVVPFYNPRKNY